MTIVSRLRTPVALLTISVSLASSIHASLPEPPVVPGNPDLHLPAWYCRISPCGSAARWVGALVPGGNQSKPTLAHKVNPTYSPVAKAARIEGDVTVRAVVAHDGTVEDVRVISGPPLLIPAVIAAVKQWRYRPQPEAASITSITITFRLPLHDKSISPADIKPHL
jgi:TonB family protein